MTDYELIIDAEAEDDDHLAVAQATALMKEYHPDANVFDVTVYDEGRIGLHVTTAIEANAEGPIVTVEEV